MRILIDARAVGYEFSGVGHYVLELVRGFSGLDTDDEFVLIVHGHSPLRDLELDARFRVIPSSLSPENHPFGDLWEELVLPGRAQRLGADVIHGPAFLIPWSRTKAAKIATVHDLVAYSHPETIPRKYAVYMRWLIARAVRKATRIITVSTAVKNDLLTTLNAHESTIDCVHHGVADRFRPPSAETIDSMRRRLGLERPYLLFVGNLEPRKNLTGLIRAFRELRRTWNDPLDLVIAGKVAWLSGPLLRELDEEDVRASIHTLGYVEDADLPALYAGAVMFVFPTFWEGFGLPVLEAMASGTPVVASGIPCIREVAGDAATYVDPASTGSITEGIRALLVDPKRRADLVDRGRKRAAEFTWNRAAEETLATYRRALEESTHR